MKQLKIKQKNKKDVFHYMTLGTLGASLLGNLLTGKRINWEGEGITKAWQSFS